MRMAHSEKPDLILLDLHLPAGGGEFVMESLAAHPETASIPIVIMTGDPDVDRSQMKSKGAVEVFCKPMDVHAFLNTIRRALEPPAATAGLEPAGPVSLGDRAVGGERSATGTAASSDLLPA